MKFLLQYMPAINSLCSQHRVKSLYAFGSVTHSGFNSSLSDVDLIVDFVKMNPEEYADNYYDLKFALQDLLHRPVDLLEEQAITNPYFLSEVKSKRELIYGY